MGKKEASFWKNLIGCLCAYFVASLSVSFKNKKIKLKSGWVVSFAGQMIVKIQEKNAWWEDLDYDGKLIKWKWNLCSVN